MTTNAQVEACRTTMEPDDFIDLDKRAIELGLNRPTGLCFLPHNIDNATSAGELLYEGDIASLRVLFRSAGVVESRLEPDGVRTLVFRQKNNDLVVPAFLITGALLSENPSVVNIALGIIANYATDFFRGSAGEKRVRFSIVIKDATTGRYKRFKYSGDPDGIKDFAKLATRIDNGDTK